MCYVCLPSLLSSISTVPLLAMFPRCSACFQAILLNSLVVCLNHEHTCHGCLAHLNSISLLTCWNPPLIWRLKRVGSTCLLVQSLHLLVSKCLEPSNLLITPRRNSWISFLVPQKQCLEIRSWTNPSYPILNTPRNHSVVRIFTHILDHRMEVV